MLIIKKVTKYLTKFFTLWIILSALTGYFYPEPFLFINSYLKLLLSLIMLCMGLTLKVEDFKEVFSKPLPAFIGIVAQFSIMPFLGFTLAKLSNFGPEIASGFVLVGCCPGGVASNLLVYLSKGNVALSVAITSMTTLLAPVVMPVLMLLLASRWVDVDPYDLFLSTIQIVIVPIVLGLLISKFFPSIAKASSNYTPALSSLSLIAIVLGMVALNKEHITGCATFIFLAVVAHNVFGYLLGYFAAYFTKQPEENRRAISMEVGVQNAGLGMALAYAHFTPLTALPSVMFAVWGLISGSLLAGFWGGRK